MTDTLRKATGARALAARPTSGMPRSSSSSRSNTRPHAARERVRGELLAEAAGGPVITEADVFGAALLADLADLAAWAAQAG